MSDCIEWTGATTEHGYGRRSFRGKTLLAHRIAFFEAHGHWPNVCRHTCDNPPCINTDHLIDGTTADNQADMVERGRSTYGERHPLSKLTEENARLIVAWSKLGHRQRELATVFYVKQGTISRIASGKRWPHVLLEMEASQ